MKLVFTTLLFAFLSSALLAQVLENSPLADSTQGSIPVLSPAPFVFSGYVEAYYVHDFTATAR
jgi:hypothetical protein